MKPKPLHGLLFRADKRFWTVFAPGWRLWRWLPWIWRRLRRIPTRTQRLVLPEGEAVVRAEEVRGAASKVVVRAGLGGRREA